MGRPKLNQIEDGSIVRGDELYANDGAILSETFGNLDNGLNITKDGNFWVAHVAFKKSFLPSAIQVAHGLPQVYASFVMPTTAILYGVTWYGLGDDASANTKFDDNSGAANNNIKCYLSVKDLNLDGVYTLGEQTLEESNLDYTTAISTVNHFATGWLVEVTGVIHASAHSSFSPFVQGTFTFREEHV